MQLDRLSLFLAIVDTGTVSAAARQVHLTQPAVSRNLKLLEEDLGTPLFDRQGRGLVLTAAGRALVPRARRLLADAANVAREVARTASRRYFDLRLGTVDSVATWLLPRIVAPLAERFPDLQLKIQTARTAELRRRLGAGELDLAIIASSGPPADLRATRAGRYGLAFYGRADRFAALAEATTEEAVQRFPIVEIELLPGQQGMIGPDATSFAVASSLASVKALILAGFGVGALLDFMLTPAEAATLVRAPVGHDPDCALFVVGADDWRGEAEAAIEQAVAEALAGALARPPAALALSV